MLDSMYAQWGDAIGPWILPLAGVAVVFVPLGVVLLMWGGRRRFARRNAMGVEQFRSYGHSLGSRLVEGIVDRIGILLFALGLFAAFAAGYGWFLQRY